jgi:aryl-alcohol dehydrogenase-like predicted oxidoreductase
MVRACGCRTSLDTGLASGVLIGKYLDGIPQGSRASLSGCERRRSGVSDERRNEQVRSLARIAEIDDLT